MVRLHRLNKIHSFQNLIKNHACNLSKFSLLGATMTAVSFGALYLQVHNGVAPTFAYMLESIFTLQLGFGLNRYLVFGDRSLPFLTALLRWNTFRAITLVLSQVLYFVLIHVAKLEYLLASVTVAAVFGLVNYSLSHTWAFAKTIQK